MQVIAMRVKAESDVPNSKNLRVYTFEAPEHADVVVVANRSNVYKLDDVVAVALVGTKLPESYDNLEIVKRSVFGIESSGMALGPLDSSSELGSILDPAKLKW